MTANQALILSTLIPAAIGLLTFLAARWDRSRGNNARRDANVLQIEQNAFERATRADVTLIERLQERVDRAEKRAEESERREIALAQRVNKLERAMAAAGLDIPA